MGARRCICTFGGCICHFQPARRPVPGFQLRPIKIRKSCPWRSMWPMARMGAIGEARGTAGQLPWARGDFFLWYLAGFCSEMLAGSALRYTFAGAINRNSSQALARPPRPPLCWGLSVVCTSTFSSPSPAALAHFRGCIGALSVRPPENYLKCR